MRDFEHCRADEAQADRYAANRCARTAAWLGGTWQAVSGRPASGAAKGTHAMRRSLRRCSQNFHGCAGSTQPAVRRGAALGACKPARALAVSHVNERAARAATQPAAARAHAQQCGMRVDAGPPTQALESSVACVQPVVTQLGLSAPRSGRGSTPGAPAGARAAARRRRCVTRPATRLVRERGSVSSARARATRGAVTAGPAAAVFPPLSAFAVLALRGCATTSLLDAREQRQPQRMLDYTCAGGTLKPRSHAPKKARIQAAPPAHPRTWWHTRDNHVCVCVCMCV